MHCLVYKAVSSQRQLIVQCTHRTRLGIFATSTRSTGSRSHRTDVKTSRLTHRLPRKPRGHVHWTTNTGTQLEAARCRPPSSNWLVDVTRGRRFLSANRPASSACTRMALSPDRSKDPAVRGGGEGRGRGLSRKLRLSDTRGRMRRKQAIEPLNPLVCSARQP